MAITFKLAEVNLEKIMFDGATKHLKENLRKRLMEQVTKDVDDVVESTFKQLALNVKSYVNDDSLNGQTNVQYVIKVDGVEKIRDQV